MQCRNGLQANVIHSPEHRRENGEPHQNHHPLEIDGVSDVRRAARDLPGGVEQRRRRFKQRIVFFQLAAVRKVRLNFVKQLL